jgi:hypothetical protein
MANENCPAVDVTRGGIGALEVAARSYGILKRIEKREICVRPQASGLKAISYGIF